MTIMAPCLKFPAKEDERTDVKKVSMIFKHRSPFSPPEKPWLCSTPNISTTSMKEIN